MTKGIVTLRFGHSCFIRHSCSPFRVRLHVPLLTELIGFVLL